MREKRENEITWEKIRQLADGEKKDERVTEEPVENNQAVRKEKMAN